MNIYDIAKLAGVSIATVSRVVNNSPNVSERTKQRVLAVMEEHHYTPNVFARGLGLDSMKTIGIVCPDVRDAYVAGLVASLEGRLREYGYDCILYCSGYKKEKKEQAVELILQKRIDALVLAGATYAGGGLQNAQGVEGLEDLFCHQLHHIQQGEQPGEHLDDHLVGQPGEGQGEGGEEQPRRNAEEQINGEILQLIPHGDVEHQLQIEQQKGEKQYPAQGLKALVISS